jgi:hypothetical protein
MTIWRIRIACLISKATNTHSKYAVLIAFPLQKRLHDGTTVDSWPLKMGPIGCSETSVRKCHHTLCHSPEERSSHVVRGGSLKCRIVCLVLKETQCVYCAVCTGCLNIIQDLIRLHSFTQSSSYRLFLCACSFNLRITVLQTIANCHWTRWKYKHIDRIFWWIGFSVTIKSL